MSRLTPHDRLKNLRQTSSKGFNWRAKSSLVGLKRWGFLGLWSLLLLSFLGLVLVSRVAQSYARFQARQTEVAAVLSDFLTVAPNLESELRRTLEEEVLAITAPLDDFFFSRFLTRSYLARGLDALKEWKTALERFTVYELSAGGLRAGLNEPTFSAALEDFLLELPDLLTLSRAYLRSFWPLRILGLVSADLGRGFGILDRLLRLGEIVAQNPQPLLQLFGHYSTQRLVVVNQNPGEARPTGGFTGSYLSLDVSQGRVQILESQSIYHVSGSSPKPLVAHPQTWHYEGFAPHGVHNLNFFSCFRDSAELFAAEFGASRNGFTIDQLYFVTPALIQSFLPVDFVLEVPGLGVFNEVTLFAEIERISSLEAVNDENPKEQLASIFAKLLEVLPEILQTQSSRGVSRLALEAVRTRTLQFWFAKETLRNFTAALGLHSNQICLDLFPKTVSFVLSNMSVDKRNLITQGDFSISAKPLLSGVRLRLHYRHTLGSVASLQRGFNRYFGRNFFGFVLPSSARNIEIKEVSPALNFAARKPYYYPQLAQNFPETYTPPVITRVANSAVDLPNGVLYTHPDGSVLAGAYFDDQIGRDTKLTVEFDLPRSVAEGLRFYPQPGLLAPTLTLGRGVALFDRPTTRTLQGVPLKTGVALKFS